MRVTHLIVFAALAIAATIPASASAGWVNELGRRTGLGWSDGYHAYEGCPDKRLRSQPWQRRANRGGAYEEPLVPYLEPTPAPQPAPEPISPPNTSRPGQPGSAQAATSSSSPARTSQL